MNLGDSRAQSQAQTISHEKHHCDAGEDACFSVLLEASDFIGGCIGRKPEFLNAVSLSGLQHRFRNRKPFLIDIRDKADSGFVDQFPNRFTWISHLNPPP